MQKVVHFLLFSFSNLFELCSQFSNKLTLQRANNIISKWNFRLFCKLKFWSLLVMSFCFKRQSLRHLSIFVPVFLFLLIFLTVFSCVQPGRAVSVLRGWPVRLGPDPPHLQAAPPQEVQQVRGRRPGGEQARRGTTLRHCRRTNHRIRYSTQLLQYESYL